MALECLLLTRSSRLMELADANLIPRDGSKVLISVEIWSGHQAQLTGILLIIVIRVNIVQQIISIQQLDHF